MTLKQLQYAFARAPEREQRQIAGTLGVRGMQAGEPATLTFAERLAYLAATLTPTQYDSWMVITDDSFYEPEVDYQLLADSGVDAFIIRGYGPTSWNDGAFAPAPDPAYFKKFKAAKATTLPVGSYGIHNPWEMTQDVTDPSNQIQQWKEVWYGEFMPHFLVLDAEINYCYRSTGKVIMPQRNYTETVRWTMDAMLKEWAKALWLYSRVTFLQEAGGAYMQTMLDNFNAGGNRAHLHLAYYPAGAYRAVPIQQADELKPMLPAYSGAVRSYLEYGATDVSTRIWQASPKLLHPACPRGSLDWNICPLSPAAFRGLIGMPSKPPAPPPPPQDDAWKASVETRLGKLEQHTHPALPPAAG